MQQTTRRRLVYVAVVAIAASASSLLALRLGRPLYYTDGESARSALALRESSMLVWSSPQPECELPGPVEGRAARLPDGRWIYGRVQDEQTDLVIFDAARPGLPPEPVPGLNSPGHDFAPALAADGTLYFTSDRSGGAGGFDIWTARLVGSSFTSPRALGGSVNGELDEADPAPEPGSNRLVFVRRDPALFDGRNGELWLADLANEMPAAPLLAATSGPFIDRDPAFAPDGRTLWFVRQGAGGDRRVMRTWSHPRSSGRGGFVAPLPVDEWSAAAKLRAPEPGKDLAVWLLGEAEGVVYLSKPVEVMPWWEGQAGLEGLLLSFLIGATLLLILLLLGGRWHQIDILTQCLLASLLLHLLLMLWMMRVELVRRFAPPPVEPGGDVEVRLVPAEAGAGSVADGPSTENGEPWQDLRYETAAREIAAAAPAPGVEAAARGELQASVAAPADVARQERAPAAPAVEDAAAVPVPRSSTDAERAVRAAELRREARTMAPESAARPEGAAAVFEVRLPASQPEAVAVEAGRASRGERVAAAEPPKELPKPAAPTPAEASVADAASADSPRHAGEDRALPAPRAAAAGVMQSESATVGEAPARPAPAPSTAPAVAPGDVGIAAMERARPGSPEQAVASRPSSRVVATREVALADAPAAAPQRAAGEAVAAATGLRPVAVESRPAATPMVAPAQPTGMVAAGSADPVPSPDGPERAPRSHPAGEVAPEPAPSRQPRPVPVALADAPAAPSAPTQRGAEAAAPRVAASAAAAPSMPRDSALPAPERRLPAATSTLADSKVTAAADLPKLERRTHQPGAPAPAAAARPRTPVVAPGSVALRDPAAESAAARPTATAANATAAPLRPDAALLRQAGTEPVAAALDRPRLPGAALPAPEPPATELARPARTRRDQPVAAARRDDDSLYRNRFGERKVEALLRFGGNEETERAVEMGLRYLAGIQRRDGSWGNERRHHAKYGEVWVGKTSLCVLAFLGAGHTQRSGTAYSTNVASALHWLASKQDADSGHFGATSAYSHGITTYALAECYAMTKDETLRAPLEQAVRWILYNQDNDGPKHSRGGWGYFSPSLRPEDSYARASTTAWQVMALESARRSGIEVPADALTGARQFLIGLFDDRNDYFLYNREPSRLRSAWRTLPASTPASVFCLLLLGMDAGDERLGRALDWTVDRKPRRYRRVNEDEFVTRAEGNVYYWYYGSLACFFFGGEIWEEWNEALKTVLPRAQERDGSFRPIDPYAAYAGDNDGDRSYTTAMCVLSLEVYYRYFTPLLRR